MRLQDLGRFLRSGDPTQLFRRYFVNTLFDSTFVVLGILAASAFSTRPNIDLALGAIFGACLAIGISTGVSVFEAEHTEDEIRLRRLERAMLTRLRETEVGERIRATRWATALVNFLAPLFVAGVTGAPIFLYSAGILKDFIVAAGLSSALGMGIIFVAGYHLGSLIGRKPWRKAIRMTVVAVLTFLALVTLERLF